MSAIVIKPFGNEAEVAVADGGLILTLAVDFGVIDRLEGLLGKPMDECIGQMFKSAAMQGKFLWAMTRKHHSDLTLDQVAGIQFSPAGPAVMAVLGSLLRQTFNFGEPDSKGGEGEQSSRPPRMAAPPKAKSSRGASSASSGNGARRGSGRRTSGAKRRARS